MAKITPKEATVEEIAKYGTKILAKITKRTPTEIQHEPIPPGELTPDDKIAVFDGGNGSYLARLLRPDEKPEGKAVALDAKDVVITKGGSVDDLPKA